MQIWAKAVGHSTKLDWPRSSPPEMDSTEWTLWQSWWWWWQELLQHLSYSLPITTLEKLNGFPSSLSKKRKNNRGRTRRRRRGCSCHKIVSCRTMKSCWGNPLSRKVGFCLSVHYHWQINFPFKGSSQLLIDKESNQGFCNALCWSFWARYFSTKSNSVHPW